MEQKPGGKEGSEEASDRCNSSSVNYYSVVMRAIQSIHNGLPSDYNHNMGTTILGQAKGPLNSISCL